MRTARIVAYAVSTALVAYELVASAVSALRGSEYGANLTHLDYPQYISSILGVWDFPGAVTLLVPRFRRLKEWAYAGAFFKYSGAVASLAFTGNGPEKFSGPLVFAVLTLTSWALRPPDRRIANAPQPAETRAVDWAVPIAALAGFVVIALLTRPK